MSLFSEIEKTIERGFRHWTEKMFGAADSNELLLVHRAILEEIETKVQTVARGKRVFPFSHLKVTLARLMRTAARSSKPHSPRAIVSKRISARRLQERAAKSHAASWSRSPPRAGAKKRSRSNMAPTPRKRHPCRPGG